MSYAADIKSELMQEPSAKECCARAELAALFFLSGSISLRGLGKYCLTASSENAAVIRYCYALVKRLSGLSPQIRAIRSSQRGEHVSYQLQVEGREAAGLLKCLDMLDSKSLLGFRDTPSPRLLKRDCCKRAYLKAAFLACGWAAQPEKSYHIELAAPDDRQAATLKSLMGQWGLEAGMSHRKSQTIVYVKNYDGLEMLLGIIGASSALMNLVNVRMMKTVHNGVNRQLICDNFNTDRTVSAATAQQQDIEVIRKYMGLDRLPEALRMLAEARLNNLDATLTELGELLSPPVGKSTVNNRMRRLASLAQKLRSEHNL